MNIMKIKILIPICLMVSFVKGNPISKQISETEDAVAKLSEKLTVENINLVIEKIDSLVKSFNQEPENDTIDSEIDETEIDANEIAIGDLEEDSMFLKLLKKCFQEPSREDLIKGLEEWQQCKPRLSPLVEKAKEKLKNK